MHSKIATKQQNIAIVLGPKCVNATGLIRSLGQAGFFVVFASRHSKIESKWTKSYLHLPKGDEKQMEILYQYICSLPSKPAIFTVDDNYNQLLDEQYKRFVEVAFIPHANGKLIELCDKAVMSEMAKNCGLNVANFSKVNLDKFCSNLNLPMILKPYAGYAGSKGDIFICRTEGELFTSVIKLKKKNYKEVFAQEFLQDKNQFEVGLMGIALPNGEVEIPCVIKKIRSYPEGKGSTSYAQISGDFSCIDKDALKSFVRATGYVGLFDVEMIVSKDKAYFIEINYRNGQYGYAVTKAGYNLPANWFNGMMGMEIEKNVYINDIFYMNEREDKLHVKDGKISKKEWKKQFKSASAYGTYCKGDQRPYVRQYVKIPDRIKIKVGNFFYRLKDLLIKEEWNIAIRKKGENLLYEDKNTSGFIVLKNTFRYWCADPFLITKEGKDYLFFEMYDRFKAKGLIGYRIIENGKVGKIKKAMEKPYHLSFPNVFERENEVFLLPESCGGEKTSLYKAMNFPNEWKEECVLLEGKFCDSVFIKSKGKTYLLTQPIDNKAVLERYQIIEGVVEKCEKNPIVKGSKTSRNAGAIIEREGKTIRVSQNCLMGYGLSLNFHEVDCNENYIEKEICSISPLDLPKKLKRKYVGVHTYNVGEKYEVIDLKNKSRIKCGNVINILYRIKRRIFR